MIEGIKWFDCISLIIIAVHWNTILNRKIKRGTLNLIQEFSIVRMHEELNMRWDAAVFRRKDSNRIMEVPFCGWSWLFRCCCCWCNARRWSEERSFLAACWADWTEVRVSMHLLELRSRGLQSAVPSAAPKNSRKNTDSILQLLRSESRNVLFEF